MLKFFLKLFFFCLAGLLIAVFFQIYGTVQFKEKEIKLEAPMAKTGLGPGLKGLTETEWQGRKVYQLEVEGKEAVVPFSTSLNGSLFLRVVYYQESGGAKGEKIKLLINHNLLREIVLETAPGSPGEFTATIPRPYLRNGDNHLRLIKTPGIQGLYINSLKIRNFKGYSTGLFTAYVLPLPLTPAFYSQVLQVSPRASFFLFPAFYILIGLGYGLILSRRRKVPLIGSLGQGIFPLMPSFALFLCIAVSPQWIGGQIILSPLSFLLSLVIPTVVSMAAQLRLIHPLWGFSKKMFQKLRQRPPLVILLLITGAFMTILFLYSLKFDKNITGFMVIGDYFEAPQIWTSQTLIHKGSVGYDGQFYYYIAHDPFVLSHSYSHIDFPAYRYQRIIYPLAAWLLSFGQPKVIPYMMIAVNLLGIILGSYGVILILKHYRRTPWYSLYYAVSWGLLLCLLRCLPEALATGFVVWAVFFFLKEKPGWQVFYLALAALTQETTLLVTMAFLFYFLWKKDFRRSLYYLLFPPLAYLLWQLYIFSRFRIFSFLGGTQNFGLPFWGLWQKFYLLAQGGFSCEVMAQLLYLVGVFVLIIIAFCQVLIKRDPFTLSFAGYALMTTFLNKLIWVEPWSYGRATLGLLLFNLLIFTKDQRRLNLIPMLLMPIIFLLSLISMKLL